MQVGGGEAEKTSVSRDHVRPHHGRGARAEHLGEALKFLSRRVCLRARFLKRVRRSVCVDLRGGAVTLRSVRELSVRVRAQTRAVAGEVLTLGAWEQVSRIMDQARAIGEKLLIIPLPQACPNETYVATIQAALTQELLPTFGIANL